MGTENIYHAGETIPETALYECKTCGDAKRPYKLRLKKGESFPPCEGCGQKEVWEKSSSTLDMSTGCHC